MDFEGLAIVAVAFANIAGDIDIGQKMHLDLVDAVTAAGFAAAALDIEAEAAIFVATARASWVLANSSRIWSKTPYRWRD
jgi:hypothetical protein